MKVKNMIKKIATDWSDTFHYIRTQTDSFQSFFSTHKIYMTEDITFTRIPKARPTPEVLVESSEYGIEKIVKSYEDINNLITSQKLPIRICYITGRPITQGWIYNYKTKTPLYISDSVYIENLLCEYDIEWVRVASCQSSINYSYMIREKNMLWKKADITYHYKWN